MADPHNPNTFTDNPLDRAALKRNDAAWVAEALRAPDSLFVPLWRLQPLVTPAGDGHFDIGWAGAAALQDPALDDPLAVLLGLEDGRAHFSVDVSALDLQEVEGPFAALGSFADLRESLPRLGAREASILAQAKAMIDWHRRHGYCAACGADTMLAEAGYRRDCGACGTQHFPRTDPVVIAVVVKDDKCLLGRNARFPGAMFSALAGFLEPGESIEEGVAREVFEEVGIKVGRVSYHSSQPWPFVSSIMIGCVAEAETQDITLDPNEIAEARWFSRDELRAALARAAEPDFDLMRAAFEPNGQSAEFFIPAPYAIAHQLIKTWVESASPHR